MRKLCNPVLLRQAQYALTKQATKQAFVPAGDPAMDPEAAMAAGGAPPMDPAMGGAPPMDPAMGGAPPMGAPPPMDPAMGGAPPMSLAGDPMIQQIVEQTVQAVMEQTGAMGEGAGAGKPKAAKVDPAQILQELQYTRKLLTNLHSVLDVPLPPDILDTPDQTQAQPGAM